MELTDRELLKVLLLEVSAALVTALGMYLKRRQTMGARDKGRPGVVDSADVSSALGYVRDTWGVELALVVTQPSAQPDHRLVVRATVPHQVHRDELNDPPECDRFVYSTEPEYLLMALHSVVYDWLRAMEAHSARIARLADAVE